MTATRHDGVLSQRVRHVVRLSGQGILTLLIFAFDLVKSVSGGGASSSAIASVVLPPAKSDAAPLESHQKTAKRRRRANGRTN